MAGRRHRPPPPPHLTIPNTHKGSCRGRASRYRELELERRSEGARELGNTGRNVEIRNSYQNQGTEGLEVDPDKQEPGLERGKKGLELELGKSGEIT